MVAWAECPHFAELPSSPGDDFFFDPARVTFVRELGKLRVRECETLRQDGLRDSRWTFGPYVARDGVIVPERMTRVEYSELDSASGSAVEAPQTQYDYRLRSASCQALPEDDFDPAHWLKKGEPVQDERGGPAPIEWGIRYDPARDLIRQLDDHWAHFGDVQRGGATGGFFLGVTLLLVVIHRLRLARREAAGAADRSGSPEPPDTAPPAANNHGGEQT